MQKFDKLTGVAAPLPMINIDTDMIIPKQHLKTIKRTGLGKALFDEMRYEADGSEKPGFVLNQPAYRKAQILVAGANFGCGSSREHAPWALLDFGIRCVIAPSFADIHLNNCYKNGLLPVVLSEAQCEAMRRQLREHPGAAISVDLAAQTVRDPQGQVHRFEIHPVRKKCLLEGLDDIARTLQYRDALDAFEAGYRKERPWLYA